MLKLLMTQTSSAFNIIIDRSKNWQATPVSSHSVVTYVHLVKLWNIKVLSENIIWWIPDFGNVKFTTKQKKMKLKKKVLKFEQDNGTICQFLSLVWSPFLESWLLALAERDLYFSHLSLWWHVLLGLKHSFCTGYQTSTLVYHEHQILK